MTALIRGPFSSLEVDLTEPTNDATLDLERYWAMVMWVPDSMVHPDALSLLRSES